MSSFASTTIAMTLTINVDYLICSCNVILYFDLPLAKSFHPLLQVPPLAPPSHLDKCQLLFLTFEALHSSILSYLATLVAYFIAHCSPLTTGLSIQLCFSHLCTFVHALSPSVQNILHKPYCAFTTLSSSNPSSKSQSQVTLAKVRGK